MSALSAAIANRLAAGASSAAELMQALRVSQTTISRALRDLERQQRVIRIGSTRGARYALREPIDPIGSQWPLYRIDEDGIPHELGALTAVHRDIYYVAGGPARIAGRFQGLPYYLQDARPGGFLGRTVPGAHPQLGLPARVSDWTDRHVLIYLTQHGSDCIGDLIVGADALNKYLAAVHAPTVVPAETRASAYPAFADAAMAGAPPGSSAQGE